MYYRLSVVNVNLPPLRERLADIPLLANHFLNKYADKYHKRVTGLKMDTLRALESYAWPGNVRELENVIERMVILAEPGAPSIHPDLLPENILHRTVDKTSGQSDAALVKTYGIQKKKADYEKEMIIDALEKNNWNQTTTAEELGLHESTLRYRMKKFGIKKR